MNNLWRILMIFGLLEPLASVHAANIFPDQVFMAGIKEDPAVQRKIIRANTVSAAEKSFNEVCKFPSGMFKAGRTYRISFTYKFEEQIGPRASGYSLLRSKNKTGQDYYFRNFGGREKTQGREEIITTVENVNDYYLIIGIFGKAKAVFSDFKVDEITPGQAWRRIDPLRNTTSLCEPPEIKGIADFMIEPPTSKNNMVIWANDYGLSTTAEDNTEALTRAAQACRNQKASRLEIKKGIYRFKNPKPVRFDLLQNVLIEGNGAEFIVADATPGIFMLFNRCEKTELRNITVDWDWRQQPLATRAEVISVHPRGEYVDLKLIDYRNYSWHNANMNIFDVSEPNRLRFFLAKPEKKWLANNVVRLTPAVMERAKTVGEFTVGRHLRIRHFFFVRSVVRIDDCRHLTLDHLRIHSFPGGGFIVWGHSEYILLRSCEITPRLEQEAIRPLTTTADHCHIIQSRGHFKMEKCTFTGGGDDMVNIRGVVGYGIVRKSPRTLLVSATRSMVIAKGDQIELRDYLFRPVWTGIVMASKWLGKSRQHEIEFSLDLPEVLPAQTILTNRTLNSGNFIIRDCNFSHGEANGIVVQAPNGIVENCRLTRLKGCGIVFSTGYGPEWQEGDLIDNVIVRGNRFNHCNAAERRKFCYPSCCIAISMYSLFEQTSYPVITNVLFENNTFIENPGLTFMFSSARNIVIKNNRFLTIPSGYKPAVGHDIILDQVNGIWFLNNVWGAVPPSIIIPKSQFLRIFCRDNHMNCNDMGN